jgi:hypothetical protein
MKLSLNLIVRPKEELAVIIKNSFAKKTRLNFFSRSLITGLIEYTKARIKRD